MKKSTLSSGVVLTLPKDLHKFIAPLVKKAQSAVIPVYLVGGCVRDILLKKKSQDVDIVVEGPATTLARDSAKSMRAELVSHPQFLTYTLVFKSGRHLDIATARVETYPEPAALPVVEPASIQDDLYRRDFSINAIALSLNENDFGHIWDPFGGVEDLKAGKVRVLHSESFKDDPTRVFRAARFAGRFGYELDWRTREWLTECIEQQLPSRLSGARLREELIPLLMETDPRPAFRILQEWGGLGFWVSGLTWDKTHETLFAQVLRKAVSREGNPLLPRLLALFHAVPLAKAVGAMAHMMFPQALTSTVEQALSLLSQLREGSLSAADVRVLSRKPLSPEVKSFLEKAMKLRLAGTSRQQDDHWKRLHESAPCLSGQDVRDLGYKPGPVFSKIFDALREARWEGKLRTREEEIRFVKATFPLHVS